MSVSLGVRPSSGNSRTTPIDTEFGWVQTWEPAAKRIGVDRWIAKLPAVDDFGIEDVPNVIDALNKMRAELPGEGYARRIDQAIRFLGELQPGEKAGFL